MNWELKEIGFIIIHEIRIDDKLLIPDELCLVQINDPIVVFSAISLGDESVHNNNETANKHHISSMKKLD